MEVLNDILGYKNRKIYQDTVHSQIFRYNNNRGDSLPHYSTY